MVETDLRISQAGPAGNLIGTDKVPLARNGMTAALSATVDDIARYVGTNGAPGVSYVATSGATMTGPLILSAPPTQSLEAATRSYVDGVVPVPSTILPMMDSKASVGFSLAYARADHVHPATAGATGTVSNIASGPGLSGGPITTTGTLSADWHAGVVATVGAGLSLSGGTLSASSGSGTVTTTGTPISGNLTAFSGGSSITSGNLSGDVTTSGSLVTALANTTVTPGSYTSTNLTVDSKGRITAASNGSAPAATIPVTNVTGNNVSRTFLTSDQGTLIRFSGLTGLAPSFVLPQAGSAGFPNGWFCYLSYESGPNSAQLQTTTSTIHGRPSPYYVAVGAPPVLLVSDGTNWQFGLGPTYFTDSGGGWALQIADGTATGGNVRGALAVDLQLKRSSAAQVASGNASFAAGDSNTVSAQSGSALGLTNAVSGSAGNAAIGQSNTVSASNGMSFAAGYNNQVTGGGAQGFAIGASHSVTGYIATALGFQCTASNSYVIAAGYQATASGTNSVALGTGAQASGSYSMAFGGNARSSGTNSFVIATNYSSDHGNTNAFVTGSGGPGTTGGNLAHAQHESYVFFASTAGTAATRLTSDGATAAAANVAAFRNGIIVGEIEMILQDTSAASLGYTYTCRPFVATCGGTAASFALVGSPTFTAAQTVGSPAALAAGPTVTADTGNGGLNISFTPPAGNSHTWYAVACIRFTLCSNN